MGRAWNGNLLGVIVILHSDGLLIVPLRGYGDFSRYGPGNRITRRPH
jgi:hypothetical protein